MAYNPRALFDDPDFTPVQPPDRQVFVDSDIYEIEDHLLEVGIDLGAPWVYLRFRITPDGQIHYLVTRPILYTIPDPSADSGEEVIGGRLVSHSPAFPSAFAIQDPQLWAGYEGSVLGVEAGYSLHALQSMDIPHFIADTDQGVSLAETWLQTVRHPQSPLSLVWKRDEPLYGPWDPRIAIYGLDLPHRQDDLLRIWAALPLLNIVHQLRPGPKRGSGEFRDREDFVSKVARAMDGLKDQGKDIEQGDVAPVLGFSERRLRQYCHDLQVRWREEKRRAVERAEQRGLQKN